MTPIVSLLAAFAVGNARAELLPANWGELLPPDMEEWLIVSGRGAGEDGAVSSVGFNGPRSNDVILYFLTTSAGLTCRVTTDHADADDLYAVQRWCFERLGSSLPAVRPPPIKAERR
jgi:hypothetical protein